ncbi:hypothetical protein A2U01_0073565, partial [Trifolium medium]|nr:hypothetical protein [Trifolium medium]
MNNITITLKVLDVKVIEKLWILGDEILESMVGDETIVIVLMTLVKEQNEQVKALEGKMVKLRNSRIEILNGFMRL